MSHTAGGGTGPGWYADPAGRFEFRYHNGSSWTSDVASNGQRYIDPLAPGPDPGAPLAPWPATAPPGQGSNGIAVAALVCGIVSVAIGWLPVVFVAGAVLAVLGIVFGIVGLRAARAGGRRRGFAITGIVTGAFGVLAAVAGLVFTIVVVRAIDRYEDPPESSSAIDACEVADGWARAEGELTNEGSRASEFTVYVEFRVLPSGPVHEELVSVPRTEPGDTSPFAVDHRVDADIDVDVDVDCVITAVNGPLPFGLEID